LKLKSTDYIKLTFFLNLKLHLNKKECVHITQMCQFLENIKLKAMLGAKEKA